MKRLILAIAALVVMGGSAWGDSANGVYHPFGSAICANNLPCPNELSSTDALVSQAKSCIGQDFGMYGKDFFEASPMLDSNGCIPLKTQDSTKGTALSMIPHCCLVPMSNNENACQLKCDQYGVR